MASEGIPPQPANPALFPEGKVNRYDHTWANWDVDKFFDELEELCEAPNCGYVDCLEICADWKEENEKLKEENKKMTDFIDELESLFDRSMATAGPVGFSDLLGWAAEWLDEEVKIKEENDKLKEINKKYEKLDKDHNEMENMLKKRIEELKEEVKHYESIYSDDELHFDCEESMYNYIECDGQYVVVEKEEYEKLKEGK